VKELTKTAGENSAAIKMNRPTGEQVEVDARSEDGGLTESLSSLLGLGVGGKPKKRPNRPADLPGAVAKITQFKGRTGSGAWTKLDRAAVADRLIELVNDPDKLNQGSLGVCGAAAFFNVWIEADPLAFVAYATSLYDTGQGMIGSLEVEAGSDLRGQDYAVLRPKLNPDVPPADWMVMSALRDSENFIFDFEGTPQEDFSGGTSGGEIASWLRATQLFSRVSDDTAPILGEDLAQAKTLNPTANRKVILFIDTNMVDTTRAKGKSKHFVNLRSKVSQLANGNVDFTYWTWGDPPTPVAQPLTKSRFESTYMGSITAEF
jgi:hypothetical protein